MAGGNVSPRQKMINMMYLVLTALLALNVSAEILRAFHLVEVSLEKSTTNLDSKNTNVMRMIEKYHADFPNDSTGNIVHDRAKKARKITSDLIKYIDDLKVQIVAGADGRKEDTNGDGKREDEEITKPDDTENHANLMINNKKAEELRAKINKARQDLIALAPSDKQASIKSDMVTDDFKEDGEKKTWESVMFEHTPAAAVVTLLTKIQNDTRNTESQLLDILKDRLTSDIVVVENFTAKVIPNNGTYITQGGKYSADIFLAASTRQEANITVAGSQITNVKDGVGTYEITASGEGEKKYSGIIKTRRSTGKEETYPFEASYTVLKPLAVISATAMNVVYIGLENPISVSVPGYSAAEVTPVLEPASAGSLKKASTGGGYILTVNATASTIKIACNVEDRSTKAKKRMGEQEYRVRRVPDPIPALGTLEKSGTIAAAILKAQATSVRAPLNGFAFGGVKYTPYEYKFAIIYRKGGTPFTADGKSSALTPQMQGAISKVVKGDKVLIYEIKVQGPDGKRQLPSPLVFDVQ